MTLPFPALVTSAQSETLKMLDNRPTPWELELIQADLELQEAAREQALLDIRKLMQAHSLSCDDICPARTGNNQACPR